MNDKHTDDIAGRMRTKECCLGSGGSESLDRSSLLVSCKTRFRCFEPLCIDVMAKEMKDNAWKTKKKILKKVGGKLRGKFLYLSPWARGIIRLSRKVTRE